jgi:hydroxymethylglutaryl-CoA lyase
VSLGDTVGQGTPETVSEMIDEVKKNVLVEKLAVSTCYPVFFSCFDPHRAM